MGKCLNCGWEFQIIRSEYVDSEKIFCRECGKEVDVKDGKIVMV